jgi:hypothetical protein
MAASSTATTAPTTTTNEGGGALPFMLTIDDEQVLSTLVRSLPSYQLIVEDPTSPTSCLPRDIAILVLQYSGELNSSTVTTFEFIPFFANHSNPLNV